ncbi:MAG: hypothetical protein Hyperionvirus29_37, partial [Hyperionvirus sp.]
YINGVAGRGRCNIFRRQKPFKTPPGGFCSLEHISSGVSRYEII